MKRSMASLCWILLLVVGEAAPVLHKVISMLKSMKETGAKIKGILCLIVGGQHGIDDATLDYSFRVFLDTILRTNIRGKSSGPSYLSRGVMLVPCRVGASSKVFFARLVKFRHSVSR